MKLIEEKELAQLIRDSDAYNALIDNEVLDSVIDVLWEDEYYLSRRDLTDTELISSYKDAQIY